MNRAGLLITLAIGLIIGIVFGIDEQLDLKIAAKFYEVVYHGNTFGMRIYPPLLRTHDLGLWFVIALVTCAVVLLISNIVRPKGRLFISTRALLFFAEHVPAGARSSRQYLAQRPLGAAPSD